MVRWSIPAKNDLKQIFDYILKDSKHYADKVTYDIIERSESLQDFPQMGRMVPEIEDPSIREVLIHSYRLIYKTLPGEIEVLALVHSKRDFTSEYLE